MRNTFLEKLYTQCDGVTSRRPFSKKSKLCISLDQQLENLDSLILLNAQVEDYQNILKRRCRTLSFNSCKAFIKKEKYVRNE